jgi:hypothetical protein
LQPSRITIFAGHYGSGKTNLAVNYALWLKKSQPRVAVCDLDIVNPYFRTADQAALLAKNGITLISSPYANSSIDMPAIPPDAQMLIDDVNLYAVIDVGGDDQGALALGRYASSIINENRCDMWLVVNKYRPLTRNAADLLTIKNEIERAAGIKFNGVINNSNLSAVTTLDDIAASLPFIEEVSRAAGLPVVMTAVKRSLYDAAQGYGFPGAFPVDILEKTQWKV